MEAYERVLTDAMAGDATLFARQDYVEEAWRIVDPMLKAETPVYPYEPHTWGPKEIEQIMPPADGRFLSPRIRRIIGLFAGRRRGFSFPGLPSYRTEEEALSSAVWECSFSVERGVVDGWLLDYFTMAIVKPS